jgi:transglutaminase-like putative cysteine protease
MLACTVEVLTAHSRAFEMKLQVVHRTRYSYGAPVTDSYNEARLQPTSADGQACESFELKITPLGKLSHYLDFYFNYVHFFEVPEAHSDLTVEGVSTVTTTANLLAEDKEIFAVKRLGECLKVDQCYDFLQASSFVSVDPEVWRLAMDACAEQNDVWQSALCIMRFVHKHFKYVPNSTNVNTHMLEVVKERRGVCQDFAHVMLGMCRTMKIPARYVSGYLYNGPVDHLLGAQASHAWCEVYVHGVGWRALDPTNNRQSDDHYVKVAVGRDYADIVPLKGHYKGTPRKSMSVDVNVTRLDV